MKKYLVLMFLVLTSCGSPVQLSSEGESDFYSATSADGIFFMMDKKPDLAPAGGNASLHLKSGMFRKYEVVGGKITSAISYDDVVWQQEKGVRLGLPEDALIADLKVIQQDDGTFKMYFEGEGL